MYFIHLFMYLFNIPWFSQDFPQHATAQQIDLELHGITLGNWCRVPAQADPKVSQAVPTNRSNNQ